MLRKELPGTTHSNIVFFFNCIFAFKSELYLNERVKEPGLIFYPSREVEDVTRSNIYHQLVTLLKILKSSS